MILSLPTPPAIIRVIEKTGLILPEDNHTLHELFQYVIAYTIALRDSYSPDYILEHVHSLRHYDQKSIFDLIEAVDMSAPYILNELVLNGLNNPYIVTVTLTNFTIANKEEYA